MSAYVIEGGRPLSGEVVCSGSGKNSALKLLAAALLAPGVAVVRRVPDIADLRWFADVLRHLGVGVDHGGGEVKLTVPEVLGVEAPYELVTRMRASTAVLSPLLARQHRALVAMPGGDFLGPRPIDLHLKGLEALGAEIKVVHGLIDARCDGLRGGVVRFDWPSHGATENIIIAAAMAKGTTVIENASREPEITDLANFLRKMGAQIEGDGTSTVTIEGVDSLKPIDYEVMPDRLEAATFLFATGALGGDVTVKDMRPQHLEMVLEKLVEAGCELDVRDDSVRIQMHTRPRPVDVSTLPYPGFPTDLQPMAVAMLCHADGISIVTENVYDARFFYTDELARMGADVKVTGHYAVIRGGAQLMGAPVRAHDVSAGVALVISGLAATGQTTVEDIIHIDRRYENLEGKLAALGGNIQRVAQPAPVSGSGPA
jgi:UDP-N-acetylglucosamine 1-carboxyvinyltransferase